LFDVILQAGGLILCGVAWRLFSPLGLDADSVRRSLTGVVYVLLLPALVLAVLWRAPLGWDALRVALVAIFGVLAGLGLAWFWLRRMHVGRPAMGALMLAAAFPNVTYMGLPVLEATLGPWSRSIAIQYDLFACTPLLLTLGTWLAARFGEGERERHPLAAMMKVPPLWAALAGVLLNGIGAGMPPGLGHWLDMLGAGVVPLMLFSLGLGLRWSGGWWHSLKSATPVIVIRLAVVPALAWFVAGGVGLGGTLQIGVLLEAAMPSMVLGIVICDRYRLDTALYAMVVTLTTALSLVTLPAWFDLVR
jgi:predicted permease